IQYASLEGIPSEEIGGVDDIKNPTAREREGGLGGQIDLKTRSPLAQQMGLNLGGNLRGTKAGGADGGVTPVATLVGGFKFNDSFAITASASYDDEKTRDKQFQDQNRNQWLITNTATVGSYVGSPVASTNTTLPGGQTYIDPQLAYFTDILDEIKTKGATLGAEWKWSDDITSTFNYFFIREEETSISYSNKAWFSGGSGETNQPPPPAGTGPASFPGIDPSQPYSIDSNGVLQSATMMANGAETATLFESNRTTPHRRTSSMASTAPLALRTRPCRWRPPVATTGRTTAPTVITATPGSGTTAATPDFHRRATRTTTVIPMCCRIRLTRSSSQTGHGPTSSVRRTTPPSSIYMPRPATSSHCLPARATSSVKSTMCMAATSKTGWTPMGSAASGPVHRQVTAASARHPAHGSTSRIRAMRRFPTPH